MEPQAAPQRGGTRQAGAVKYGVLSLLCEGPSYSRELFKRLGQRVGGSWGLSAQSIYDALDGLERDGLVRVIPGTRGKWRVYYEITGEGRHEQLRWLHAPPSRAPAREEFYLKLAFATLEDLPVMIDATVELERQCVEELDAGADLPSFDELVRALVSWETVARVMVRDVHSERLQSEIRSLQKARATMVWMLEQAGSS